MVKTDTDSVSAGISCACTCLVIKLLGSVIHVCRLGTFLLRIYVRAIVEVVAGEFHVAVEKIPCAVGTTHP